MHNPLWAILRQGRLTQGEQCPDLTEDASGLPAVSDAPCAGSTCQHCARLCPTRAITVTDDVAGGAVALDRGRCIGCNACVEGCPSATLVADRSTRTATRTRAELVLTNRARIVTPATPPQHLFAHSLHVREVSTGCNATDLEVLAITNAVFDVARFGIHFVASPRFADALLVTGPVGRAMHEPLRRCYDAMADPRIVIAAGTSAISGGLHGGGYAEANGIGDLLPVACYIPGEPPHPWSIIHGLLLAMGRADG
jgi:Ni,Fe-hydrogenase III small subunit/ferredoxin